jgi:hypothetical protein
MVISIAMLVYQREYLYKNNDPRCSQPTLRHPKLGSLDRRFSGLLRANENHRKLVIEPRKLRI